MCYANAGFLQENKKKARAACDCVRVRRLKKMEMSRDARLTLGKITTVLTIWTLLLNTVTTLVNAHV